jgi:phasin family protein
VCDRNSCKSAEQVVDLNFATARASVADSAAAARQLLAARDPQELLSVTAAQAQPAVVDRLAHTKFPDNSAATAVVQIPERCCE